MTAALSTARGHSGPARPRDRRPPAPHARPRRRARPPLDAGRQQRRGRRPQPRTRAQAKSPRRADPRFRTPGRLNRGQVSTFRQTGAPNRGQVFHVPPGASRNMEDLTRFLAGSGAGRLRVGDDGGDDVAVVGEALVEDPEEPPDCVVEGARREGSDLGGAGIAHRHRGPSDVAHPGGEYAGRTGGQAAGRALTAQDRAGSGRAASGTRRRRSGRAGGGSVGW